MYPITGEVFIRCTREIESLVSHFLQQKENIKNIDLTCPFDYSKWVFGWLIYEICSTVSRACISEVYLSYACNYLAS